MQRVLAALACLAVLASVAAQEAGDVPNGAVDDVIVPSTPLEQALRYIAIVALLCMSALFSGLNIGLINLDPTELEVGAGAGVKSPLLRTT